MTMRHLQQNQGIKNQNHATKNQDQKSKLSNQKSKNFLNFGGASDNASSPATSSAGNCAM